VNRYSYIMKLVLLTLFGLLAACQPVQPEMPAEEAAPAEEAEADFVETLKGRIFTYEVTGYQLQLTFQEETELHWEYLSAPEGEELISDVETINRTDVYPNIVLMSWTEDSGYHIVDVLDLETMTLHVTAITPEGERFVTTADVTEVNAAGERQEREEVDLTLKGRVVSYEVLGYHIQLTFEEETQLHWEYLSAPEGEELISAVETIDRTNLRSDIVLMSWTEESGYHVIDVMDLSTMTLHVTGIAPDDSLFVTTANLTEQE